MKGVGWEADGCLNIAQAKKAGELLSDVSDAFTQRKYTSFKQGKKKKNPVYRRPNTDRRLTASGSPRWPMTSPPNTPRSAKNCRAMWGSNLETSQPAHFTDILPVMSLSALLTVSAGLQSKHRADAASVHDDEGRAPVQAGQGQRRPTQCGEEH